MIQAAQVASRFTIFSHHAKTVKDLILSLRNSLLKEDVFRDEKIAEEQVAAVLNFNIHLVKDKNGKRYISRITEIKEVDQEIDYPVGYLKTNNPDEAIREFMSTTKEYYQRQTDRRTYDTKNIIEYINGSYVVVSPISVDTIEKMKLSINDLEMDDFDSFLQLMTSQKVERGA
jgi:pilus assembly protein CpaF